MASSLSSVLKPYPFLFFFFFLLSLCYAHRLPSSSSRPHGVAFPITKDASTLQYVAQITQRTPQVPVSVVVHLGGDYLWVNCVQGYVSSSYSPVLCKSAQCLLSKSSACGDCYGPAGPGCNNNTCGINPETIHLATPGELALDDLTVHSTDGSSLGSAATVRRFIFGCGSNNILQGLAKGAKGMIGLGRSPLGLPSQFAVAFRFPRKFALCLSSSKGVAFFGDGPYRMQPGLMDVSASLSYTTLFINPNSTSATYTQGEASNEYFIALKAIKIDGESIRLDKTLLSFTKSDGRGGTKISTIDPYTVMETSIYNAFTAAFINKAKAMSMSRVASVSPFSACFDSKAIRRTRTGALVPSIDLVLSGNVMWKIPGANSMVQAKKDVLCLGFVDGGLDPRTSVVIGGHQLEDNLLQFDIPRSKLGFSSSLLARQTACSNFKF